MTTVPLGAGESPGGERAHPLLPVTTVLYVSLAEALLVPSRTTTVL